MIKTTEGYDVQEIRNQFPILSRELKGKPLVYFDNAATSQKPQVVIDALVHYYSYYNANIHRGIHTLAEEATAAYEATRITVQQFINAASHQEIIFTRGTTESINLVAYAWGRANVNTGDEIIISTLEHHSNIVPWQMLAQEKGAILKVVPINENGEFLFEAFEQMLSERTKLVSIVHASNALGVINPVEEIIKAAHKVGALVLVDGAQSSVHLDIDVQALDCDFYAFSAHKIYGPTGVGILFMKNKWVEQFEPFNGGGRMIQNVDTKNITYASGVGKFEAGSLASAEVIALKHAIKFVKDIKIKNIVSHEQSLATYALDKISKFNDIEFVGRPSDKGSVFSFNIKGVHAHDASTVFDEDDIAVRAGHHCCQILHKKLKIGSSLRVSFGVYNNKQDIDALCESIKKCKKIFKLK